MKTLFDNDCIVKVCRYDLVDPLLRLVGGWGNTYVLPTAKFSLKARSPSSAITLMNSKEAAERLFNFLSNAIEIKESDSNKYLAALSIHPQVDAGEAILFAMALDELETLVYTGDKRSIAALAEFLDQTGLRSILEGRIKCLEQVVAEIIEISDFDSICKKIRADKATDKTLYMCFNSGTLENALIGLLSHY